MFVRSLCVYLIIYDFFLAAARNLELKRVHSLFSLAFRFQMKLISVFKILALVQSVYNMNMNIDIHMGVLVCLNMSVSIVIRFYISILCVRSVSRSIFECSNGI